MQSDNADPSDNLETTVSLTKANLSSGTTKRTLPDGIFSMRVNASVVLTCLCFSIFL
jgi:hypothetical protein